jgi:hypothetical protein
VDDVMESLRVRKSLKKIRIKDTNYSAHSWEN